MFRVYDTTDNLGLLSTPAGLHPCQGSYETLNLPTHPEHRVGTQAYQSLWLAAFDDAYEHSRMLTVLSNPRPIPD